jgi:hypothetical protein
VTDVSLSVSILVDLSAEMKADHCSDGVGNIDVQCEFVGEQFIETAHL